MAKVAVVDAKEEAHWRAELEREGTPEALRKHARWYLAKILREEVQLGPSSLAPESRRTLGKLRVDAVAALALELAVILDAPE